MGLYACLETEAPNAHQATIIPPEDITAELEFQMLEEPLVGLS